MVLLALALAAAPIPAQDVPRPCAPPPRGVQTSWVTNDDYPSTALMAGQQGIVEFTLDVGIDGCVTACRIDRSSGYPLLDTTTCSLLLRRARFKPAQDDKGKPVAATWSSQFKWMLPPPYPIAPEPWAAHALASYSEDGRLLSCTASGDAAETHLARFCQFASRIPAAQLAILRKDKPGSFLMLMEGAGRFDGQAAVPAAQNGDLFVKVTLDFGIDAQGYISSCDARDETPAALVGRFRHACEFLTESYVPTRDAVGQPVPRRGSIAIVYTMPPPPRARTPGDR